MLGNPITGPNDARDLNGDGRINQADVQALLALCGDRPVSRRDDNYFDPVFESGAVHSACTLLANVSGDHASTPPTGSISFLVDGPAQRRLGALNGSNHTSVKLSVLPIGSHTITGLCGEEFETITKLIAGCRSSDSSCPRRCKW